MVGAILYYDWKKYMQFNITLTVTVPGNGAKPTIQTSTKSPLIQKACPNCHKEFTTDMVRKVYCSKKCCEQMRRSNAKKALIGNAHKAIATVPTATSNATSKRTPSVSTGEPYGVVTSTDPFYQEQLKKMAKRNPRTYGPYIGR